MLKVLGMVTAAFMCSQAYAGGISLYEFDSPDVGLAAAGYAARAQDASTLFTNPAGMSFLDRSQVMAGLQGVYGCVQFNPDSGTTTSGGLRIDVVRQDACEPGARAAVRNPVGRVQQCELQHFRP